MSTCPNCRAATAGMAASCAACGAMLFGRGWHPIEGERNEEAARPRSAQVAVVLLYAALPLNVAYALLSGTSSPSTPAIVSTLLLTLFSALLIYLISRGRNWARVAYLVAYAVSCLYLPSLLAGIAATAGPTLGLGLAGLAGAAFQFVAMLLLFTSPATDWYRLDEQAVGRSKKPR